MRVHERQPNLREVEAQKKLFMSVIVFFMLTLYMISLRSKFADSSEVGSDLVLAQVVHQCVMSRGI